MVEHDGLRQVIFGKYADFFRIVGSRGRSRGPGQEDGGNGMVAGVACRIGVSVQLPDKPDVQPRFFFGFPDCRRFQGFAVINETSGEGPPPRDIFSFD